MRIPSGTDAVIGRAEWCDVVLADPRVSREHLRIEWREGVPWAVDTSTNGVFLVDGVRTDELSITSPTRVHLGAPDGAPVDLEAIAVVDASSVVADPGPANGFDPAPPAGSDVPPPRLISPAALWTPPGPAFPAPPPGPAPFPAAPVPATQVPAAQAPPPPAPPGPHLPDPPQPAPPPPPTPTVAASLVADRVRVQVPSGAVLVHDVSFTMEPGTLTAVLGPTGAGKSTVLRALAGLFPPASGSVLVGGRDLYTRYDEVSSCIGYVPQDDIVHTRLTARQALGFGAELRLPDGTSNAERDAVVSDAAASLGLADHLDKRIANLSGGQRKRVSVALELLTRPQVLLLDEPTSGLDPGYEDSLMQLFRDLADEGRTVVVVTHSTASLDRCDQVIYLGTGGWVAYAGPPGGALAALGAHDHPSLFRSLESPPPTQRPELTAGEALPAPGVAVTPSSTTPAAEPAAAPAGPTHPNSAQTQFNGLVRRSLALLFTDPRALAVSMASAAIPAVLLALVVGTSAFSTSGAGDAGSARTLLTGVIISAGVIGAANGLREVVKELPIYQRERVAGLRRSTYLLSKVAVLGTLTLVQSTIVVLVATIAAAPGDGNLFGARPELVVAAGGTAVACLMLGLFISALVDTSEKALAMIPVVFVVLWLFSGTVSDLAETPVLSQLAYLSPSNWGVAAGASAVDLPGIEGCGAFDGSVGVSGATGGPAAVCDARWGHSFLQWAFDLVALVVLGVAAFLASDWALARKEHLERLRHQHLVGAMVRAIRSRVGTRTS